MFQVQRPDVRQYTSPTEETGGCKSRLVVRFDTHHHGQTRDEARAYLIRIATNDFPAFMPSI
jgi:DNA-nicking Smr family endonuclease